MLLHIEHITILVKNQDEALNFYKDILGFEVLNDTMYGQDYRWIEIALQREGTAKIVLVKADTPEKEKLVGKQVGSHVLLTLQTDNLEHDYQKLKSKGVRFQGEPRMVPWGKEVVFEDLYGNRFDLVERRPMLASRSIIYEND